MVSIVQLAECQIVALEVVSSSLTTHPILIILIYPLGCSQAVRHKTLTLAFRRFESCHPSQIFNFFKKIWQIVLQNIKFCYIMLKLKDFGPLAQLVEHMTFNHVVPRSNRGWITIMRMWRNWQTRQT